MVSIHQCIRGTLRINSRGVLLGETPSRVRVCVCRGLTKAIIEVPKSIGTMPSDGRFKRKGLLADEFGRRLKERACHSARALATRSGLKEQVGPTAENFARELTNGFVPTALRGLVHITYSEDRMKERIEGTSFFILRISNKCRRIAAPDETNSRPKGLLTPSCQSERALEGRPRGGPASPPSYPTA